MGPVFKGRCHGHWFCLPNLLIIPKTHPYSLPPHSTPPDRALKQNDRRQRPSAVCVHLSPVQMAMVTPIAPPPLYLWFTEPFLGFIHSNSVRFLLGSRLVNNTLSPTCLNTTGWWETNNIKLILHCGVPGEKIKITPMLMAHYPLERYYSLII